jgi:hypothetical protein
MNYDLIERYTQKEAEKMLSLIDKKGIDCIVTPIIENEIDINDIDVFSDEFSSITKLNPIQNSNAKNTFGNSVERKIYFLNSQSEDMFWKQDDENNEPIIKAYINDFTLSVGSEIFVYDKVKYKIGKILTNYGASKVVAYSLIKG